MENDIFGLNQDNSLVRILLESQESIDLRLFDIPEIKIPNDYALVEFLFNEDPKLARREVAKSLKSIMSEIAVFGYDYEIYPGLYEAVLNAHEHGNKRNPNVPVMVAYTANAAGAEFIVIDSGGIINSRFISFILKHRERREEDKFLNFYEFSGLPKPSTENLGNGTSFMHTYADSVNYYRSAETGGLAVKLTKKVR